VPPSRAVYSRQRRRRWPYVLLTLVVLLAAAGVAVDLYARAATESALASRVRSVTGARSASVTIGSLPFLWDVAVDGRLPAVDVVADHVPVGPIVLDQVTVDAHDVRLERRELLQSHRLVVTSVGSATLSVLVNPADVLAAGGGSNYQLAAKGNALVLYAGGLARYTVDLARAPVIPDCSFTGRQTASGLYLTCRVAPVPAGVVAALSQASG
jgi:hypothetical protein